MTRAEPIPRLADQIARAWGRVRREARVPGREGALVAMTAKGKEKRSTVARSRADLVGPQPKMVRIRHIALRYYTTITKRGHPPC